MRESLDKNELAMAPEIEPMLSSASGDLGVKLKYEDGLSELVVCFLGVTLPIWAGYFPRLLCWFWHFDPGPVAIVLMEVLSATLLFTYWINSRHLWLDRQGIMLPAQHIRSLRGKLRRDWNDLTGVHFHYGSSLLSKKPDQITLRFKHGEEAVLPADAISTMAMEKLFFAMETFATELRSRGASGPGIDATRPLTCTQLWEEELGRRFNQTLFIPLEPGHKLVSGKVTIAGQLAFGGLSAVYLAKYGRDQVILKESCIPEGTNDELSLKARELFAREASLLTSIRHEHIASVIDYFVENNRHYLLLELIKGRDLRQLTSELGPQPERIVISWGLQIAKILDYLHQLTPPVVHRDLTPENLVLTNQGHITVIDFGAANLFLGTATGTVVGKQSYMAPEQVRGKTTPQSDIYALGCTLMFLLTGKDPEPICQSDPLSAGVNVSPQLASLVGWCTKLETAQRAPSAQHVMSILQELEALSDAGAA